MNKKQLLSKELIWVPNLVQTSFCKTFLFCVQRYSKVKRNLTHSKGLEYEEQVVLSRTVKLQNFGNTALP